jgi:uncharacterized protein (DUF362 family)
LSLVSYVKVQENKVDSLSQSILDSLNLINYSFKKDIKDIAIKPNMCYYWDYTTGQTTDPRLVAALIEVIRNQISPDVNIYIVEADASAMRCKYAFKILGYEKLAKEYNVKLVNLAEDECENVDVTVDGKVLQFKLPYTIRDADLRINMPKIKYMVLTKVSGALKNIFGCNPIVSKYKFHPRLDETIVALNKIMKMDLSILDAMIVSGRVPAKLDLLLAGQDIVAVDAAAAKLAGVNPKSVSHIVLANKEGLGNISFMSRGENPGVFEKRFPRRKLKDKILTSGYKFAVRTGLLNTEML